MCVGVHVRLRVGVGVYNYMHVFVTWMCNALLMRLSVGVHAGVCVGVHVGVVLLSLFIVHVLVYLIYAVCGMYVTE